MKNICCREARDWKRFSKSLSAIKYLLECNVWLHQVISISVKRLDLFVNIVVDLFYQFYLNSKSSTCLRNSACDLWHAEFTILLFSRIMIKRSDNLFSSRLSEPHRKVKWPSLLPVLVVLEIYCKRFLFKIKIRWIHFDLNMFRRVISWVHLWIK